MRTRTATLTVLGTLLLAAPAAADFTGDAALRAPTALESHHVHFTLLGDPWVQESTTIGGSPSHGHYRIATQMAGGGTCTLTATVVAKSRRLPLVAKDGKVALSPGDTLTTRRSGRHGPVRWWAGRRGSYGAAALGSQRLPAKLVKGGRRYLDYRVTIQHFAEAVAGYDACYALARDVSVRAAQTMQIVSGVPVYRAPVVEG